MMDDEQIQDVLDRVSRPLTWAFMGAMTGEFLGAQRVAALLFAVLLAIAVVSMAFKTRRYARRRGVL